MSNVGKLSDACMIRQDSNLVTLSVTVAGMAMTVAVVLGKEEVFVDAISGEQNGGGSQTGEQSLEAVPSREGTGVSPSITVK